MAAVTVSGSTGTPAFFPTSTPMQTAFAQQVLGAAFASLTNQLTVGSFTGQVVTGAGGPLTSALTLDLAAAGSLLTGVSSVPGAMVALGGQGGVYITGGTAVSTVVAADNSNSSIVNSNPSGALLAATGAGGNVLLGLAGANNFITGLGGQDIVFMDGTSNSLTSNGSEAVLVGGPSTVTAGASGIDNVLLTSSATLNFINGSKTGSVDSITGAANSTVVLAGYGATSVASGAGPESFYVDTSSGNVTLNGNMQTTNTFEFVQNMANATGNVLVNNFATGDAVDIHGYASFKVAAAVGNASGSVLQLSDGSQVTFSNLATTALQAAVKIV